ncbi:MAG: hypothetical protein EOQ31_31585 [Mesorhizobium sp.]|uniref:HNH endonuclease n=1 Tax=Mesorhizobium sp. TaxID=1871066 RepID=UPI000FE55035|nr:HNH endonuclease [Mesorhizobium sp.]RWA81489.1 MAG: hypothetical protein EOQ31_31585 [Mesorhizobium sp.]
MSGKPANGTVKRWLDQVAIPYQGRECLLFPFSRLKSGHGRVSSRLGANTAHAYVALRVHGARPDGYEVCHDCGNPPCVNPRHLYWGTRAKNMDDRWRHGEMVLPPTKRGVENGNSVLTEDQARYAKARLKAGVSAPEIAERFGVPKQTIYNIKYGTTWAWL